MKRILVVGGGLIGIRHIEAVLANPACRLVGLADPDMTIRPDIQRYEKMQDVDQPIDGVIIATPTHLHAAHAKEAAKRGWHMLIEKPLAGTLKDAQNIKAAMRTSTSRALVGHHRRYHASVQQLKSLLAEGSIGQVVNTALFWAMRKPDAYFDGNWRAAGGSPVMINLVHDIDLLRHCIGEISETVALRGASLRGTERIESGAVALAFENGATGTINFADTAPSPWGFEAATGENPNIGTTGQDMLWITGTEGAISFPSMTLWQGSDWGKPARRSACAASRNTCPPLDAQLRHFIDVMDGADPLIDVDDAARTLAVAMTIETQLSVPKAADRQHIKTA